jgi:hypothetical protein
MTEENWVNQRRREDWDNLPFLIRQTVVEQLSSKFNLEFSREMQEKVNSDQDWWKEYEDWGIELRAFLRQFFKDDELPKNSWEYYWVSAIEKSVEKVIDDDERENS